MKEQIKRAAAAGASLLVFPELFLHEYLSYLSKTARLGPEVKKAAEKRDGTCFQELSKAARENRIAVCYGYAEMDDTSGKLVYYNSAQFIDANGVSLSNYRKAHLWEAEESAIFQPGDKLCVFDWDGLTVGLAICYDIDFPEFIRSLVLKGAQLIVVPTALEAVFQMTPRVVVPTRAIENGVHVLYANYAATCTATSSAAATSDTAAGSNYTSSGYLGMSCSADPLGKDIMSAGTEEALLLATVELLQPRKGHATAHAPEYYVRLSHRRPELYQECTLPRPK